MTVHVLCNLIVYNSAVDLPSSFWSVYSSFSWINSFYQFEKMRHSGLRLSNTNNYQFYQQMLAKKPQPCFGSCSGSRIWNKRAEHAVMFRGIVFGEFGGYANYFYSFVLVLQFSTSSMMAYFSFLRSLSLRESIIELFRAPYGNMYGSCYEGAMPVDPTLTRTKRRVKRQAYGLDGLPVTNKKPFINQPASVFQRNISGPSGSMKWSVRLYSRRKTQNTFRGPIKNIAELQETLQADLPETMQDFLSTQRPSKQVTESSAKTP